MIERPKDNTKSWAWDIAASPWEFPPVSIQAALKAYEAWRWEPTPALIERAKQLKIIKEEENE